MDISKFVYDSIVKEAVKAGSTETIARRYAGIGQKMFNRSAFGHNTVGKMIEQMVKDSVKESKIINKKSVNPAFVAKRTESKPIKQVKKKAKVRAIAKAGKGVSDCGLWSKKL